MIVTEPKPYEIVYADFAWPRTPFGTAKTPYNTMTWEEIDAFDLRPWLAKDAVVFLWMTGPTHLRESVAVEKWRQRCGLHEAGMAYIWIKTTKAGVPMGATGPRPRLVKQLGEYVLALTTKKRGRALPLLTESQCQYVFAPRSGHSRKPPIVRDNIVELLGDRPRVELFGREQVPGWDVLGDEVE